MTDEDDQPPSSTRFEWWRALVQEQAWVIHVGTGTVGRVARFYDGEGHVYEPRLDKASAFEGARSAPVLEFEEGHTFHAVPDQFMRLSEPHARFYAAAVEGVRDWTFELAKFAAAAGIPQAMFEKLVGSAMRGQLRAMSRERVEVTTDPPEWVAKNKA